MCCSEKFGLLQGENAMKGFMRRNENGAVLQIKFGSDLQTHADDFFVQPSYSQVV